MKGNLKKLFSFCNLGVFGTLLISSGVYAALPPYFQSSKEIIYILNHEEVKQKIESGRPIESIIRTKTGYLITTENCKLDVDVNYAPNITKKVKGGKQKQGKGGKDMMVGPVDFEINVGELNCEANVDLDKD